MADIAKTEQDVLLHAKQAEVQEQSLNAEVKKRLTLSATAGAGSAGGAFPALETGGSRTL